MTCSIFIYIMYKASLIPMVIGESGYFYVIMEIGNIEIFTRLIKK